MTRRAPASGGARPREGVAERRAIVELARLFAVSDPAVVIGVGDDAAVLHPGAGRLVWTVDASVEGAHFDRRWLSLPEVGGRAFHAAASDLAAMGARPLAALSSLILPAGTSRAEVRALGRGQAAAAAELACPIVGGNIASGEALSVTTTVLGLARRPLGRSTARVGAPLWLVGDVGLAAAGLRLLAGEYRRFLRRRAAATCVRAWRRPRALIAEGAALAPRATAGIDVSDGLGGDAGQLAAASGVCLVIEETALRPALRAELAEVAAILGQDPLTLALEGGEDYALLMSGRRARTPAGARRIGRVQAGEGAWLERSDGTVVRLGPGYEHGRR